MTVPVVMRAFRLPENLRAKSWRWSEAEKGTKSTWERGSWGETYRSPYSARLGLIAYSKVQAIEQGKLDRMR
jgi:hypothetical protein